MIYALVQGKKFDVKIQYVMLVEEENPLEEAKLLAKAKGNTRVCQDYTKERINILCDIAKTKFLRRYPSIKVDVTIDLPVGLIKWYKVTKKDFFWFVSERFFKGCKCPINGWSIYLQNELIGKSKALAIISEPG